MEMFTTAQLDYLATQRLGRLATVDQRGAPQNNPVGFFLVDGGDVVVGGHDLAETRKFRNVQGNARVALVVDDIASLDPWSVRGVEIRGRADAVTDAEPLQPWMGREQIRIHPHRIISWGLDSRGAE
jgi:pyridoxamine 5'-phosphate oxidase family protein